MENLLGEVVLDKKRRLAMGKVLKEKKISSFEIYQTDQGYLLRPKVSIPAEEVWIFKDPKAKESLIRGLSQKPKHRLGSFAKHAEKE